MRSRISLVVAAVALAATGCSSDDADQSDAPARGGDEEPADEPAGEPSGGAPAVRITIDGEDYVVEPDVCFNLLGSIESGGPGVGPNGETFYGGVSYGLNFRNVDPAPYSDDELAELIANGDIQEDISVTVDIGREGLLPDPLDEDPDDEPSFRLSRAFGNDIEGSVESYEKTGATVTGRGTVIDVNGVATTGSLPVEFTATCPDEL